MNGDTPPENSEFRRTSLNVHDPGAGGADSIHLARPANVAGRSRSHYSSRRGTYDTHYTRSHKDSHGTEFTYIEGAFAAAADGGELDRVSWPPIFGGLINDYKRRMPFMLSDWTDGFKNPGKCLSAGIFMFLETFASTIALSVTVSTQTGGRFGPVEFILANAIAGMFDVLIGCQPFLVLRPTAGDALLLLQISQVADLLGIGGFDFYTFYAWVGVFVGTYSWLTSAFEISRYIKYTTRFSQEILATFICSIYAVDGIQGIYRSFLVPGDGTEDGADNIGSSMFALVLTLVCWELALAFNEGRRWPVFSFAIREWLVEWALILAALLCVGLSYIELSTDSLKLSRVDFPDKLEPTFPISPDVNNPLPRRPWVASLGGIEGIQIFYAAITAFPVYFYFYIAQNVTAVMFQAPEMKLKKGSYYNATFATMGTTSLIFPFFGLPFCISVLPHPIQFIRAMSNYDRNGEVTKVIETRLCGVITFAGIGALAFLPPVVRIIPNAAVNFILMFIGFAGLLYGNQVIERMFLFITASEEWPRGPETPYTGVEPHRLKLFTLLQMGFVGLCWGLNVSPAGVAFPLVIFFCIPFRIYVLPKLFTEKELALLDYDGQSSVEDLLAGERGLDPLIET